LREEIEFPILNLVRSFKTNFILLDILDVIPITAKLS
jgi:hypothetical protein